MTTAELDILEDTLRKQGRILDTLLSDRTAGKNIIWGTDSYTGQGRGFSQVEEIKPELVTDIYGRLIQPRAVKSREEQQHRTRDKGEVFTPLRIVGQMNSLVDRAEQIQKQPYRNWREYVSELKLEIACGEAPFIVSRYNPTAHTGHVIELKNRVGFLDHKLRMVSRHCNKTKDWLKWAKVAFQSSYGYEWQGDNLLIARENLLYSLTDYYKDKFGRRPSLTVQQEFAEIISWNLFQMDGIRYVIPMSCRHETEVILGDNTLFGIEPDIVKENECEGCKFNRPFKHNGKYVSIMDWSISEKLRFVDLLLPEQVKAL